MNSKDPKLIAIQFNECINNHDLAGLGRLMTDDHTFIDREGRISRSKPTMMEGWRRFFELFPEYRNTFTRIQSRENLVAILGFAYWSEEEPHDSAMWTATIADDLVQEWRVYVDSEANRRQFDLV